MKTFVRTFSTKKLFFYLCLHLLVIFTCSASDKIMCNLKLGPEVVQTYGLAEFGLLNLFYICGIGYTIFAYVCIIRCLRNIIHIERSLIGPTFLPRDWSSDLSISFNTFVTSPQHREEEKRYVTWMKVYSTVLVTILILRYLSWLCLCIQYIVTGDYNVFPGAFVVYKISLLILYLFYFGSNVAIFYGNDEEFRLKLIRPIRNGERYLLESVVNQKCGRKANELVY